ncbi:MAG: hypothetical protein M3O34_14895 [Chloroflexota bacterium]|nr:hypothetical protein [Chloroflexota bacterium]
MTNLFRKRSVVAGAAALALVGATLGVAGAQQTPSPSPSPTVPSTTVPGTQQQPPANAPVPGQGAQGQNRPTPEQKQQQRQQFLNAVASRLNISATQLQQAIDGACQELGIPERGLGGPGGRRGHLDGPGGGPDVAAQALGISVDQLRQELTGRTLAEVAQARNVNPTTVANAMKSAANAKIDEAAAAGRIPADQVATAKQQAAQRIDQMMTRTAPARPAGQPGARTERTGGTLSFSFR